MSDDKIKCLFHDNAIKYYNPLWNILIEVKHL
jgi:hypothetical protein